MLNESVPEMTAAARRIERIGNATLYQAYAEDVLPLLPLADAVVTDPPYGIGEAAGKNKSRTNLAVARDYGNEEWDNKPITDALLQRVMDAGKWAIIFGGNYYMLPPSPCWLVWDKENTGDFADCELAWTNLPKAVRRIRYMWNGMLRANNEPRGDHPTQKPVGVMTWALAQLPDGCRTVIDPFMGSGTTGVSCAKAGLSFIGIEKSPRYFDIACERITNAQRQTNLLDGHDAVTRSYDQLSMLP